MLSYLATVLNTYNFVKIVTAGSKHINISFSEQLFSYLVVELVVVVPEAESVGRSVPGLHLS